MRFFRYCFVMILAVSYFPLLFAQSVEGLWTSIDDKTNKPRSIIQLSESDGTLTGKIVKVFKQPGDTGICAKCPGDLKDKPIKGLSFLWGLKQKNDSLWTDGKILDPKSGKIYKAKITAKGDKLFVRGYIGMAMLGRTQVWLRQ